MKKKYREALGYLYPAVCPLCGRVHPDGICPECRKNAPLIETDYCLKCGRPIEDGQAEYCALCAKTPRSFEACRALFEYKGNVKDSVYRMKNSNKREYAYIFGEEMARLLSGWIRARDIDLIVPVPLHKKRMRERGYNQSALIARAIGEELGIEVDEHLLKRVRDTGSQKNMEKALRQRNVDGAFKAEGSTHAGRVILLVDDIITTGSTLDSAAKGLKEGALCRVYAAAAAAVV